MVSVCVCEQGKHTLGKNVIDFSACLLTGARKMEREGERGRVCFRDDKVRLADPSVNCW